MAGGCGIACYSDRWTTFCDGPCWPRSDTGPLDAGPASTDAGVDATDAEERDAS